MTEPLISVVVPVYGIDRYLGICIESLIKQTYKNLEIILVDDGSPDRCPELCDLYARKDARIRVIHQKNKGLVEARKAGLAAATGTYAGYVDGDDWVEPSFYEELYRAMAASGADLVVAGQKKDLFDSRTVMLSEIPAGRYQGKRLQELKKNMISFGEFFRFGITTYLWNKLFRREMLLPHQNAVDPRISIGEDAAVVYPYLMDCRSVQIIDCSAYHYRQREDSMLKKTASFAREAAGLRLLYGQLQAFAARYPEEYRLKEQVDDLLLATAIMRSGGVLKELQEEYTPYSREFYGKDIVIWNAGTFGQQLAARIRENGYCRVVGMIDEDFWEYRRCCLDVDPADAIDDMRYDYILIATVNSRIAESIRTRLLWRGIPAGRILTVSCPREMRQHLLERYLSLQEG